MSRSDDLFKEAKKYLPGGVNSPVRGFQRVGGQPVFFKKGEGPYLIDEDDKRYIDYVGSWGPMIVGHAHPTVIQRLLEILPDGLSFGAPTEIETRLAEKVCQIVPSIEMIRMTNSGTEATMSAIRLARGFTGRDKIIKFEGCYHGHSDSLLVKAGSGALTLGEPDSPGVPRSFAEHTLTLEFNNAEQVAKTFSEIGDQVAALIVEPVAGNMSCIPPEPGFLESLREQCDKYGTLLIFDEVMTGFRVSLGGAQELYGVTPDLTTLGKVIGGGMPVGAFGGRRDIMELLSPLGPVYQAGTLAGNPIAMTAGLATLELITEPGFFESLNKDARKLMDDLTNRAAANNIPFTTNQVGGMFGVFFSSSEKVSSFAHVMNSDTEAFNRFFNGMLSRGINLAPSPFESGFVSSAHTPTEFDKTVEAADETFKEMKQA
ncbi:MAG: glutamate-1-semialdehyde 2,1-aminomutase [Pseudomonadales bacterium]